MISRVVVTYLIAGCLRTVWGQQNECVTLAVPTICRLNSQLCFDADINTASSSTCQCPSYLGFQNAATPCTQTAACGGTTTCSAANQACLPDTTGGTGFECGCIYPDYCASTLNAAATPRRDECIVQCPGCADTGNGVGNLCNVGGQVCVDPDHTATTNYRCECPYPSTGTAGAQALATCTHAGSECDAGTPLNSVTCTSQGQKCIDITVGNIANDWKCVCLTSSQQSVMSAVADCQIDECTARCQSCAWKNGIFSNGGGNVCQRFGQFCVDPNKSSTSLNDWYCTCPQGSSATAAPIQEPLFCIPTATTDDCRTATNGIFLQRCPAGQYCVDPTPATTNGDWECRCLPPSSGTAVAGAAATCVLNECMQENKGLRCLAIGQTCTEVGTNPSTAAHYDDWSCNCVAPMTGTGAQTEATCTMTGGGAAGDCDVAGWQCTNVGRACTANGPVCACPAPLVLTAGVCVLDECTMFGSICTGLGQLCTDPIQTIESMNDWYCSCTPPAYGERVGNYVRGWSCLLDECNSVCDTCPQNTTNGTHLCHSFGQTCSEGSQSVDYDWVCACSGDVNVITGTATNGTANCSLPNPSTSECVQRENVMTCGAKKQACVDPSAAADDVTCACVVGTANTATPPSCDLDECADTTALPFTTCAAAGQTCSDPNPDVSSMGDWTCSCMSPRVGTNTAAAATNCDVYDECLVVAKRDICLNAGQICVDIMKTDAVIGDWQCQCPHDTTQFTVAAAATCTYAGAQCLANSANCGAAKYCNDITGPPASYECLCPNPYTAVSSMAATPLCTFDECMAGTAANTRCATAGQTCVDTDTAITAMNTWECRCVAPQVGSKPADVATCVLDECTQTPNIKCPLISQVCSDPNTYVLNTWICIQNISHPLDECTENSNVNNDTCAAANQTCVDPNTNATSTDDWACFCLGLNNAVTTISNVGGVVASCPSPTAAPDTAAPPTPTPVTTVLDECAASPCGSQTCNDPVKTTASLNDFICSCTNVPQANSNAGSPATCDECADSTTNVSRCGAVSVTCTDPNPTDASLNDYVCSCPTGGNSVGTVCTVNECTANPCGNLQTCTENSLQITGDYRCECFGLWKIGGSVEGCDTYDYSLMFRFETTQPQATYNATKTIAQIVNIINFLADGSTQDTMVTPTGCRTCAYVTAANLRNECVQFGATLASLCKINSTSVVSRDVSILQAAGTGVGVFELIGSNEAKENWKDALFRSQPELQSDPAVAARPGSLQFFPIGAATPSPAPLVLTPPSSNDDGLEWYVILLIVLLALCCLIIICFLIIRYRKKKRKEKEEVDKEMNERSNTNHIVKVNDSQEDRLVPGRIGHAPTVTQTSRDSSVSGINPINQEFPAPVPAPVPIATPVKQDFSPALSYRDVSHQQRRTSVIAFGRHKEGQLGIGERPLHDAAPVEVPDLNDIGITSISCGSFHTVILLVDHTLLACGEGGDGQLGFGNTLSVSIPTQITFFKGKSPTLVACGEQHTLVACRNEGLYVMGSSAEGQLGLGDHSTRLTPTLVPMFQGRSIELMACSHHSIVVSQGSVFVTGWNEQGQLGLGDDHDRNKFTEIEFFRGKRVKFIATGVRNSVVCTTDGLYTFGGNSYGQLGLGHAVRELHPERVTFFDDKQILGISTWFHTMVICKDALYTFGEGEFGKLGQGKEDPNTNDFRDSYQPEMVPSFTGSEIQSVIACSEHSVVVTNSGVYIWGNGDAGSMGHGDLQITHPPDSRVHALDNYDVSLVSCGTDHTMVYASSK